MMPAVTRSFSLPRVRRSASKPVTSGRWFVVAAAAVVIVVAATSCGVGGGGGGGGGSGGGSRTISLPSPTGTGGGGGTLPTIGGGSLASGTGPATTQTTTTTTTSVTLAPATTTTSSDSFSYWWLVGAVAVVVVLVAIVALIRHRRRAAQGWTRHVQRVSALGATVEDFISATTMTLTQALTPDRGLAIDQRINDLDVELRGLQAEAPDEQTALRVSAAVAALASLRSAVGLLVNVPPGDALTRHVGVVDARLADFDAALRGVSQPGR
jgi:hypothetical protein